ncbi:hypothetical protein H2248_009531 [Termitomyces sp. 'cryptogamus']|nr:hypothetical protein H2248_009531 [Termitomyces sp. 'cryptogamus']
MSSLPVQPQHKEADTPQSETRLNLRPSDAEHADEEAPHKAQMSSGMSLPEIPGNLDFELDMSSILSSYSNADAEKVQKRASNVIKLSQENEKLKAELKAMTDRLERAERRRDELARRQQMVMEPPSS